MAFINSSALMTGIEDQRGGKIAVELFEHRAAEGGLARADFAGHLDKAFALANAVKQMVEGFAMLRAVKQEPRVRRDVERRLGQAVIVQIHAAISAITVPRVERRFWFHYEMVGRDRVGCPNW